MNEKFRAAYLDEMEQRGVSENTMIAYRQRLDRFFSFIEPTDVRAVSRDHLRDFLAHLRDQGFSRSTQSAYVACLRSFGKWLETELWEEEWRDVFRTIRYPQVEQRTPKTVGVGLIDRITNDLDAGRHPLEKRNRALWLVAYESALRASEIAGLTLDSVDLERGIVFVDQGKGGKDRYSFIGDETVDAIRQWLEARKEFENSNSRFLFIGRGSAGLTRQAVATAIKNAAKRYTHITPHTLRRSRATHLVDSGAPLVVVQKMLGHQSPETTMRSYVNSNPTILKQQLEKHRHDTLQKQHDGGTE
jgi:site-specific recombinase XerD